MSRGHGAIQRRSLEQLRAGMADPVEDEHEATPMSPTHYERGIRAAAGDAGPGCAASTLPGRMRASAGYREVVWTNQKLVRQTGVKKLNV